MERIRPMLDLHSATATLRRLVYRPQNRNDLDQTAPDRDPSLALYRDLLLGTTRIPEAATIALPAVPRLGGRDVNSIWPASLRLASTDPATAAAETNSVNLPDIRGADGIKLNFGVEPGSIYTLLQSRGTRLNGVFRSWGNQQNALERVGVMILTAAGYSRIDIGAQADAGLQVHLNGRLLQAGQSARLADGGLIHVARNKQHIYLRTPQDFTLAFDSHDTESAPLIGLRFPTTPPLGERTAEPLAGLLAPSFQTPSRPHYINRSGESYPGPVESLRVTSGLYGPSPAAPQSKFTPSDSTLGAVYQHYFGFPPETTHLELQPQDIMEQWQWINQQSIDLNLIQNAEARDRKLREQERKQELLLTAALKGGNIDLAILLLSATETQNANNLTRRLVLRIHQLQKQRQTLSAQMAQVDQTDSATGSSQLQSLVTQASNIASEISLLQTFLQDAVASKRNIQEFASNWIQQSYQTTRSIIQSIGR